MFSAFIQRLRQLVRDESGPTAVEYAILLSLIIATCLFAIRIVGANTNRTFRTAQNALNQAQRSGGDHHDDHD